MVTDPMGCRAPLGVLYQGHSLCSSISGPIIGVVKFIHKNLEKYEKYSQKY